VSAWIYQPAGRAREYAEYACNIYRGCDHGCTYCYAPAVLRMPLEAFHGCVTPRGDLGQIEAEARKLTDAGNTTPILLCFTTDPYSPGAALSRPGWTRRVIDAIHAGGQHVTILSKGGLRALTDIDRLGPGDEFATTLTLWQPSQFEPGAASTQDRISALVAAHTHGVRTWASFEPVLVPSESLELIEAAAPWLDRAKIGTWNHAAEGKAIDWADFGHRAEALCRELGLDYYLKRDLRDKM
jgi:DNA repair photolyase